MKANYLISGLHAAHGLARLQAWGRVMPSESHSKPHVERRKKILGWWHKGARRLIKTGLAGTLRAANSGC